MSWGDGGMSENGKQWESGPMDSYHIEKGALQKIIPFQTPPPPVTFIVKRRPVEGVRKTQSVVHWCTCR
jgi:hypothetical protein